MGGRCKRGFRWRHLWRKVWGRGGLKGESVLPNPSSTYVVSGFEFYSPLGAFCISGRSRLICLKRYFYVLTHMHCTVYRGQLKWSPIVCIGCTYVCTLYGLTKDVAKTLLTLYYNWYSAYFIL
jgi:hypothetical protein